MALLLCFFDGIPETHPFSIWAKKGESCFESYIGEDPAQREALLHARKLQSRLFLQTNYGVSSRLAYSALYDRPFNAIVYPSIANSMDCNVAIHPAYADRALQLSRVYEVTVGAKRDRHFFVRTGEVTGKSVAWGPCGAHEDEAMHRFARGL